MARGRAGKKIDFTSWTAFFLSINGVAAGSVAQALTALTAGTSPATILRTRGLFEVYLDGETSVAIGDLVCWVAGLIVMPEGQGTTVLSLPISDANAPWYWYATGTLSAENATEDLAGGGQFYCEVVDSKAMRIIRPDREVQFVVEISDILLTSVVNFQFNGRTLLGF